MKAILTTIIVAICAVASAQSYPPELVGERCDQEFTRAFIVIEDVSSPVSLPPNLCVIYDGSYESHWGVAFLTLDTAWTCDWKYLGHVYDGWDSRSFIWDGQIGSYVWVDPDKPLCFKALTCKTGSDLVMIESCFVDNNPDPDVEDWIFGPSFIRWTLIPYEGTRKNGYIPSHRLELNQ